MPQWLWLIIVLLIILIVWWALARSAETYEEEFVIEHDDDLDKEDDTELEVDDFTKIEGIGDKINQILHDSGIKTYQTLSRTNVEDLFEILEHNKLGFHNPDTWSKQAKLANEGLWDELKDLQEKLNRGRES